MSKKYLLPKLKTNVECESEGCWEQKNNAYTFLIDMLEDDTISTESIFDEDSSTFPHVFEHMLLFEEAFFDEKHLEHNRAKTEWHFILMVMALKKIKNTNLNVVKVELSNTSMNPFIKAASMFKPQGKPIIYNTTWDFIYLLLFNNEPIAIFSPNTIICPAKLLIKKIRQLDWIYIEKINDKYEYIIDDDIALYTCMESWLKKLKTSVSRNNRIEVIARYEKLERYLVEFIDYVSKKASSGIEVLFTDNIYHNMNNEKRTEYKFMNFCCDFKVSDKLKFLTNLYINDIFLPKILLIAYDNKPDALYDNGKRKLLENIINNTKELNEVKIINVLSASENLLPFYALIPFKGEFVTELLMRGITTDELFGSYKVIYKEEQGKIEIQMRIQDFPYLYKKEYVFKDDCQFIYEKDLASIFLWPPGKIDDSDWKCYYTYVYKNDANLNIDIPGPNIKSVNYHPYHDDNLLENDNFQIMQTDRFPMFIRLSYQEASGYLPIKTNLINIKTFDADAKLFFDIGHSTTSVAIMKTQKNGTHTDTKRIEFNIPESLGLIVTNNSGFTAHYNFVHSEIQRKNMSSDRYFKNMLHNFYKYKKNKGIYSVEPIMDGQALFVNSFPEGMMKHFPITYINFDYYSYNVCIRKLTHIYIEQLILFAVYNAMTAGCSDFEILFLHNFEKCDDVKYGELKGLWTNAFDAIKKKTGLKKIFSKSVSGMKESSALTYRLYDNLCKKERKVPIFSEANADFGVDIGCNKTTISYINRISSDEGFTSCSSIIRYGGRGISIVDNNNNNNNQLNIYSKILSSLMGNAFSFNKYDSTMNKMLIDELIKEHDLTTKNGNIDQYHGIFDIIAMTIENNGFHYSPDIYNKKSEFKYFIDMITYNFMLLFMSIGCMFGRMKALEYTSMTKDGNFDDIINSIIKMKNVKIYLGGNGSKILRWITNLKEFDQINDNNVHELFISDMQYTIIDMLKKGFCITFKDSIISSFKRATEMEALEEMIIEIDAQENIETKIDAQENIETGIDAQENIETKIDAQENIETGIDAQENIETKIDAQKEMASTKTQSKGLTSIDFNCIIQLESNPKGHLNQGHIFKVLPEFCNYSETMPDFKYTNIDDNLNGSEVCEASNAINLIRNDLFKNVDELKVPFDGNNAENKNISMTSLIEANSLDVQNKVISLINKM